MNIDFESLIKTISVVRIIDIVIVWWLLYRLMMLIRGTKAVTLLRGVGIVIAVKLISWYVGLTTISWLTDQIINWGVIALVVVFQPEIRRGLEHLGRSALFKQKQAYQQETRLINELDDAIQYMSKRHIGALISIEMETGLEEYIKDARLAAAAAYLPLSDNPTIPKELGTRHRASVGISEVTDALTIVVSEETGDVSITRNAELMQSLSREDYRKYLTRQLVPADGDVKQTWWSRVMPFGKRGEK